jgi:hypothetical protein
MADSQEHRDDRRENRKHYKQLQRSRGTHSAAIAGASAPEVEFERFTAWGPVLAAQVDCDREEFRRVRAEMAAAVYRVYGQMGLPAPGPAAS